ncbi:MucR family transcriptional regulator [Tepidicaulis sp.]|jgi:predicted transcriptional regulator|uniref:MucR family transcriptional regulator n=1 Tax=Tepidicaulis sp. TaxID=1920809 RepID=UPI003B58C5E3
MTSKPDQQGISRAEALELASEIVSAYVSNNAVAAAELPAMIKTMHDTLLSLGGNPEIGKTELDPAVPVKKSITPEYLICLEDGKRLKMLKRYLRSRYNMSPEEYRARWNLPADYPMVAPNYAAQRSQLAKEIGLGQAANSSTRRKR